MKIREQLDIITIVLHIFNKSYGNYNMSNHKHLIEIIT